ncbi:hypothetical protein Z949_3947 [Sulfitobacter guttiformis KCTC 32187]|nr:hypothetical protein Z949_3947 [Sulfitobacter guttiformis KCTC 32187]
MRDEGIVGIEAAFDFGLGKLGTSASRPIFGDAFAFQASVKIRITPAKLLE